MAPRSGFVYFANSKNSNAVKIGFSQDPKRRVYELNYQPILLPAPHGFELLAMFFGTQKTERQLHKRFAVRRIRGEWFFFCAKWQEKHQICFYLDEITDCNCWECEHWKRYGR